MLASTNDAGRHWTALPTPGIDYAQASAELGWASGVRFVNRKQGYLFGGGLYATDDGGHHWTRLRPPNDVWEMDIGAGRAYAVIGGCRGQALGCTEAYFYRVTDGGRRFVRIGPSSPIGTAGVAVHGASVDLLAPPPAYRDVIPIPLWVSANGGRTWQRRPSPCHGEVDWDALAAWSASGLVIACGGEPGAGFQARTFYVSADAGAHWRVAGHVPGPPRVGGMSGGYIASLAAVDRATWVLGEGRGTILITQDAGRTWQTAVFTGHQGPVEGWGYVTFTDATQGVAVPWTLNGSVLGFAADGGRVWSEVGFPSPRSR